MPRSSPMYALVLAVGALGCGHGNGGNAACGIAALTAPLVVKESFARGNMLRRAPDSFPPSLPVRVVAGPLIDGILHHQDSTGVALGVEGTIPPGAHPGYGVLVVDLHQIPLGVLLFDGYPIPSAGILGTLAVGDTTLPLLGVRIDLKAMEDPKCPLFAKSGS